MSHSATVDTDTHYAIGDLARLAGVSRRTVRYYVQEGLIPAPLGVGRGNHYTRAHLDEIVRVKTLQEAGRTLDEIRNAPAGRKAPPRERETVTGLERTLWRRLSLCAGVEIHIASHVRLPPPSRLQELADWCRQHLIPIDEEGKAGSE
jgi:DNA-binding transcriptional MerR regulator